MWDSPQEGVVFCGPMTAGGKGVVICDPMAAGGEGVVICDPITALRCLKMLLQIFLLLFIPGKCMH